jgi:hypothetical protein
MSLLFGNHPPSVKYLLIEYFTCLIQLLRLTELCDGKLGTCEHLRHCGWSSP